MKLKIKKLFYTLLAGCFAFGFQSTCCAALCIGADGRISIEISCGAAAIPRQHNPVSFPLCSDVFPDQEENSDCGKCAMDIPLPGIPDGARVTPGDPSWILPPAYHTAMRLAYEPDHDECNPAKDCDLLSIRDSSISVLRTTVLLI